MDSIPSVLVATTQAAGGIAGQFIGPEIYGGSADWKSIAASHGAGFVVGVFVVAMATIAAVVWATLRPRVRRGSTGR